MSGKIRRTGEKWHNLNPGQTLVPRLMLMPGSTLEEFCQSATHPLHVRRGDGSLHGCFTWQKPASRRIYCCVRRVYTGASRPLPVEYTCVTVE